MNTDKHQRNFTTFLFGFVFFTTSVIFLFLNKIDHIKYIKVNTVEPPQQITYSASLKTSSNPIPLFSETTRMSVGKPDIYDWITQKIPAVTDNFLIYKKDSQFYKYDIKNEKIESFNLVQKNDLVLPLIKDEIIATTFTSPTDSSAITKVVDLKTNSIIRLNSLAKLYEEIYAGSPQVIDLFDENSVLVMRGGGDACYWSGGMGVYNFLNKSVTKLLDVNGGCGEESTFYIGKTPNYYVFGTTTTTDFSQPNEIDQFITLIIFNKNNQKFSIPVTNIDDPLIKSYTDASSDRIIFQSKIGKTYITNIETKNTQVSSEKYDDSLSTKNNYLNSYLEKISKYVDMNYVVTPYQYTNQLQTEIYDLTLTTTSGEKISVLNSGTTFPHKADIYYTFLVSDVIPNSRIKFIFSKKENLHLVKNNVTTYSDPVFIVGVYDYKSGDVFQINNEYSNSASALRLYKKIN